MRYIRFPISGIKHKSMHPDVRHVLLLVSRDHTIDGKIKGWRAYASEILVDRKHAEKALRIWSKIRHECATDTPRIRHEDEEQQGLQTENTPRIRHEYATNTPNIEESKSKSKKEKKDTTCLDGDKKNKFYYKARGYFKKTFGDDIGNWDFERCYNYFNEKHKFIGDQESYGHFIGWLNYAENQAIEKKKKEEPERLPGDWPKGNLMKLVES